MAQEKYKGHWWFTSGFRGTLFSDTPFRPLLITSESRPCTAIKHRPICWLSSSPTCCCSVARMALKDSPSLDDYCTNFWLLFTVAFKFLMVVWCCMTFLCWLWFSDVCDQYAQVLLASFALLSAVFLGVYIPVWDHWCEQMPRSAVSGVFGQHTLLFLRNRWLSSPVKMTGRHQRGCEASDFYRCRQRRG